MDKIEPLQWYFDLTDTSTAANNHVKVPATFKDDKPVKKSSGRGLAKKDEKSQLKVKKAWEVALAPAKSLPMNMFMSYMSGNSLQIVPIMMTLMMFFVSPVKQIAATNQQFASLYHKSIASDIAVTKAVYVICHLLAVGVGVWKLGQMGLLPNTRSDWLAWETAGVVAERAVRV